MSFATSQKALVTGISDHFRLRATCWFMSMLMFSVGLFIFCDGSQMFMRPYYHHLARLASPTEWGLVCMVMGFARTMALAINGSIPNVKFTPVIRALSSAIASVFWLQIALASWVDTKIGIGAAVFPFLVLLEIYNTASSAYEIEKRRK